MPLCCCRYSVCVFPQRACPVQAPFACVPMGAGVYDQLHCSGTGGKVWIFCMSTYFHGTVPLARMLSLFQQYNVFPHLSSQQCFFKIMATSERYVEDIPGFIRILAESQFRALKSIIFHNCMKPHRITQIHGLLLFRNTRNSSWLKAVLTEHLHVFFFLLIPTKIVLPDLRAQIKQPPLCVGLPPRVTTQHQADYVWQLT